MSAQDLRFYLRLDAAEIPYVAFDPWLVSGASYRGRYVDPPGTVRRRVELFAPAGADQGAVDRSVVLRADQLEPDVYPWAPPQG